MSAFACASKDTTATEDPPVINPIKVIPAADQIAKYVDLLKNKRVAAVVNQTSQINGTHLVDTLLSLGIDLKIIFAPEHGFKGNAYNGEEIKDGVYKNEIPLRSIYGASKKPSEADISQIDVVLFDIQDVGARFYTYISTLHYVMEAAAEAGKDVIVLDRPNPNAHYIDGPIMEEKHETFVGMHPVPIVYGMTIGEYAKMINGEGWMKDGIKTQLTVVPVANYTHDTPYELPVAPSPNLPNYRSILLYPSLCFFEGTVVNEGRGTDKQFQIYGHPAMSKTEFTYTPKSMTSSKYPRQQDKLCGGVDLSSMDTDKIFDEKGLNLSYLMDAYLELNGKIEEPFFNKNGWIHKLSGSEQFKEDILSGKSEEAIKTSWQPDIEAFKKVRAKYLIYP